MPKIEIVTLKTLSPVHTGDIERKSVEAKTSGLIGSLRWWYEAIVRGFDTYACDPTDAERCSFDNAAYAKTGKVEDGLRDVCPVCRFFGCTGWSKKFKLLVTDMDGDTGVKLDKPGIEFQLRFIERKPFSEEERWLLSRTFRLIDRYGSIGGKTTLKPPKFPDFGLVQVLENITTTMNYRGIIDWFSSVMGNSEVLRRKHSAVPKEYPNLRYFVFNRGHWLDLGQMNAVVATDPTGFLRGAVGISKKLFSFQSADGMRFWGYTTGPQMLKAVLEKLATMNIPGTKKGEEVMLSEL